MSGRTFSLKVKIIFGFLFISMVVIAQGASSLFLMKKMTAATEKSSAIGLAQLFGLQIDVLPLSKYFNNFNTTTDRPSEITTYFQFTETQTNKIRNRLQAILENKQRYNAEPMNKFIEKWEVFSTSVQKLKAIASDTKVQPEELKIFINGTLAKASHDLEISSQTWVDSESAAAEFARNEAISTSALSNKIVIFMIFIGFLGAIGAGLLIATRLSNSLLKTSAEISAVANHTSDATINLSGSSQKLSLGATQAAACLQETVASLQELSSMVQFATSNAKEANSLSQKSRTSAENGEQEIKKLISAMNEISAGSKRIEEITGVIDDIAFQTNLLALNAAVEAARAGEQGRGFAVVADAVRGLAQRSSVAAKEIHDLIAENVEKTSNGSAIVVASGAALREIVGTVNEVASLNSEISSSSAEQASGIEMIAKAVHQLEQATQNNATSADVVSGSSNKLSAQTHELVRLSESLFAMVTGTSQKDIATEKERDEGTESGSSYKAASA